MIYAIIFYNDRCYGRDEDGVEELLGLYESRDKAKEAMKSFEYKLKDPEDSLYIKPYILGCDLKIS